MMRFVTTPTLVLILAVTAGCGEETPTEQIGIIWQDEFEGPAGQLPDTEKWRFDVGTDWGNLQLEYDTNRATNVSLDGEGHLAITARVEDYQGQAYTSGRIKTKDLFQQTYGRFEARIKLPVGQGIWPAFWMLGSDIGEVGWPECGEIDIMEFLGQDPRSIYGSIHGPGHAGDNAISKRHQISQGGFQYGFHVFGVEWNATSITWDIDGFIFHTVSSDDLSGGARWVYDHPFFILLNVAVGGRWPGSPDETTEFPQTMLVDWVRVHGVLP